MVLGFLLAGPVTAQTPAGPVWWPSEWGPEDERGAANLITPERVLEAVSLIEQGQIYELGRRYETGMPLFGNRHFSLTIPGLP
ncbi:MAG: cyclase family protein, partial [Gammaproteobacteria bacterium]|nr:cyclase family protein [Gammaproteobacteria bacterium]